MLLFCVWYFNKIYFCVIIIAVLFNVDVVLFTFVLKMGKVVIRILNLQLFHYLLFGFRLTLGTWHHGFLAICLRVSKIINSAHIFLKLETCILQISSGNCLIMMYFRTLEGQTDLVEISVGSFLCVLGLWSF